MTPQKIAEISHIGFLVLRNFSMIAFANAIEPLRMANYLSRKNLYRWSVISPDKSSSPASNGLNMAPIYTPSEAPPCDILFVCGGTHVRATDEVGAVRVTQIEKKGKLNRRVRLAFA